MALSKSLRLVGRPPSSHAVQAFTTDAGGTYNCEIGGTVAVTGSIDADFAITPTTYSMDFSTTRLALTFNACKNWGAEYTLWGAVQFTITDHQEGSELTADSWNYEMSIDYFLDGGVAITNGSENFTFPYSFSFIGSGSGQIDMNTSAVTYNSYAMALNMTVSGVTCSAAVSAFAEVDAMAWNCL